MKAGFSGAAQTSGVEGEGKPEQQDEEIIGEVLEM